MSPAPVSRAAPTGGLFATSLLYHPCHDSTLVGATLLATHYLATQRFLEALSVPIEADEAFVGWSVDG